MTLGDWAALAILGPRSVERPRTRDLVFPATFYPESLQPQLLP